MKKLITLYIVKKIPVVIILKNIYYINILRETFHYINSFFSSIGNLQKDCLKICTWLFIVCKTRLLNDIFLKTKCLSK